MPTLLAITSDHAMLGCRNRILRRECVQKLTHLYRVFVGKILKELYTDQFLGRLSEVSSIGFIDEGKRRIRQRAADHFSLIFDDRTVSLFASAKLVDNFLEILSLHVS